MNNPRITAKERGLLKGAIRRVFARSELRRKILDKSVVVGYTDPTRPRVTKWCECNLCYKMEPKYLMQVDHVSPLVPLNSSLEDMSWDEVVDSTWCIDDNLMPICKPCHKIKTKQEAKMRRMFKKDKK